MQFSCQRAIARVSYKNGKSKVTKTERTKAPPAALPPRKHPRAVRCSRCTGPAEIRPFQRQDLRACVRACDSTNGYRVCPHTKKGERVRPAPADARPRRDAGPAEVPTHTHTRTHTHTHTQHRIVHSY